jgi:FMN phosphatase YigB (HAD superfamily)
MGVLRMPEVKMIFFDLGNTLYRNDEMEREYVIRLHKLLAEDRQIPLAEAENLFDTTRNHLKTRLQHATKVSAMEALGYTRKQVHDAFCQVDPGVFLTRDPRLSEFLTRLSKRFKLGIITNFRMSHVQSILDVLGVDIGIFDVVISEDTTTQIKPHKQPFTKAVELAGLTPQQCVYVADSLTKDLAPAKSVGMKTVLVTGRKTVKAGPADAVIPDVFDLAGALSKLSQ